MKNKISRKNQQATTESPINSEKTSENPLQKWSTKPLIWVTFVFLLILICMIRLRFLELPFERDEGYYSYLGHMTLQGKTPYLDFYDFKFPLIFYMYAAIIGLFGYTLKGIHLGFLFINILSILLSYTLSKKLLRSEWAGLTSAICFAFLSLHPYLSGFTTQSEHLVMLFCLLGLNALYQAFDKSSFLYFMGAGILMSLAVLTKTTAIFIAIAGGMAVALEYIFEKDIPKLIKNSAAYITGGIVPVAFFAILTYSQGAWEEAKFWTIDYASVYTGEHDWAFGKPLFESTTKVAFREHGFFWVSALLGLLALWRLDMNMGRKLGLGILLISSLLTVTPGLRFFGHYYLQIIPMTSVFFAICWSGIPQIFPTNIQKTALFASVIIVTVLTLVHINKQSNYFFSSDAENIIRNVYQNNPFLESKKVGDYLKSIAKKGDEIMIVGSEPQVYMYAGMDTPTRHQYFSFMVGLDTIRMPKGITWMKEFNNDISTKKPRFLAYFQYETSTLARPGSAINYLNDNIGTLLKDYKALGYVETTSDKQIICTFGEDTVRNYRPAPNNLVYLYERK